MKIFTKVISVVLAFALLLSCFTMQGISVIAGGGEIDYWSGGTTAPTKGSGTLADPYLIETAEEFAYMMLEANGGSTYDKGATYKLMNDIYLNDISKINWFTGEVKAGYTPRVWEPEIFSGIIQGNGHMVYGLYIERNPEAYTEKWGGGSGAALISENWANKWIQINDMGMDCVYVNSPNVSAVFIAGANSKNGASPKNILNGCYIGINVTLKGFATGGFYGGGYGNKVTLQIKNCASLVTRMYDNNRNRKGGIVGDMWSSDDDYVQNSYSLTCIQGNSKLAGSCVNDYAISHPAAGSQATLVTANNMQGLDVLTNPAKMPNLGDGFRATETFPVPAALYDALVKESGEGVKVWNGTVAYPAAAEGTEEDPIKISTAEQLAYVIMNGGGGYYKLTSNIYLNDLEGVDWSTGTPVEGYTPNEWFSGTDAGSAKYNGNTENMQFSGTLDGNGYAVYGLWYSPDFSGTTVGLIPGASSATVKNLSLSYSYVVGGRFTGAISSTFAGTANNVVVDETVTVVQKENVEGEESYSVGGFFGYTNGVTLNNCAFYGTLKGTKHIYGLVGTSWGTKIDAANSFSIGYQPFTTSISVKKYTTKEDADAKYQTYYGNIYKVSNVYTDTHKNTNSVKYQYDSDGIDTDGDGKLEYDQSVSYSVFSFTELLPSQIMGLSAMQNMPALSTDFWYATSEYPRTYCWARFNGDFDLDGNEALTGDIVALRNNLIGAQSSTYTDFNGDDKTNICDLVATWKHCPTRYKTNGEAYFLKHWMGYNKAIIVYPANDAAAKTAAESFKTKMADKGLSLAIYADTAIAETEYEVLFGNTNRGLAEELGAGIFTVTVSENGKKVIFSAGALSDTDAGNAYTNAINDFLQFYSDGFAPIITGFHTYEGSVTLKTSMYGSSSKTFTAVWGDEFYGSDLNPSKWDCNINRTHMSGYSDMVLLDDDETVNVADGRLRMTAKAYSVEGNEEIKYAAPASVHTKGLMEFKYGYAEIRAKVPFRTGIWPSFWMKGDTVLGGRTNYDYRVEVDMFEVFGSINELKSNVHKRYSAQGKAKYGLTDSQTHIMARDDQGNWLGNILDKWTNGEDTVTVSGTPEDWHTYGMAWDAKYIYMYVDHKLFRRYTIGASDSAKTIFGSDAADRDSSMSGFHDPLYVIFNNHIFTEQASYKPNTITGYESSNLPAHYDIDYFRLYQATDSGTALYTK